MYCKMVFSGCLVASLVVPTASAAIVYSGQQNIVWDQHNNPGPISIAGSSQAWDNFEPFLNARDLSYGDQIDKQFEFTVRPFSPGSHVAIAHGGDGPFSGWRFNEGELINASSTYVVDSYTRFSNYEYRYDPGYLGYPGFPQGAYEDGGWAGNKTGYAGIQFSDGANTYYGWMLISISDYNNSNITARVLGWAYEDTPGSSIQAGATIGSPVPVPAAVWLFGSALAGIGVIGRRKAPNCNIAG